MEVLTNIAIYIYASIRESLRSLHCKIRSKCGLTEVVCDNYSSSSSSSS